MRFHARPHLYVLMPCAMSIAACAALSACSGEDMAQSRRSITVASAAPPSTALPAANGAAAPAARTAQVLSLVAPAGLDSDPSPLVRISRDPSVPAASSVRFPAGNADEPVIETF
jgi:hypothetical protein